MNRPLWPAAAQAFRRAAAPLAWYYAVTLALPFVNGAAHTGAAFVEHALAVLVVPPVLIVLACAAREIARVSPRLRLRIRSRDVEDERPAPTYR
jgi:hypothetical protein